MCIFCFDFLDLFQEKKENMKKATFALLLASSGLMQAMEMTNLKEGLKNKSENKLEKFKCFEELPQDIQNEIIKFAWKNVDNKETFEKQLLHWENLDNFHQPKLKTSYAESLKYKLSGDKKPINFYTLRGDTPIIKTVGNIVQGYPANIDPIFSKELSVNLTKEYLTKIFIHDDLENKIYSATLEDGGSELPYIKYIISACFSALGDVAIIWSKNYPENFVSILTLDDIKKNKVIDLNLNAINLQNIPEKILRASSLKIKIIKGVLFDLDASKLGTCIIEYSPEVNQNWKNKNMHIEHLKNCYHSVQYVDVPHDKPLTLAEKAKRLGIEIEEVKKLVKQKTNKQKSSSHTYLYAAIGIGIAAVLDLTSYYL